MGMVSGAGIGDDTDDAPGTVDDVVDADPMGDTDDDDGNGDIPAAAAADNGCGDSDDDVPAGDAAALMAAPTARPRDADRGEPGG